VENKTVSSIAQRSSSADVITVVAGMAICHLFFFRVWHKYETAENRYKLFRNIFKITGWQLLETAMAGVLIITSIFLLTDGEKTGFAIVVKEYGSKLLLSPPARIKKTDL